MDLPELDRFLDISLPVDAIINCPPLRVSELLALRKGSIITTQVTAGNTVTVVAGRSELGQGELVSAERAPGVRMVSFRGRD